MSLDFKTEMRDEGNTGRPDGLRGQVGVQLLGDGRVYLVVMAAPNTFATECIISAADAAAMGYTLRCATDPTTEGS